MAPGGQHKLHAPSAAHKLLLLYILIINAVILLNFFSFQSKQISVVFNIQSTFTIEIPDISWSASNPTVWTREHVTPYTTNTMDKIQTWHPVLGHYNEITCFSSTARIKIFLCPCGLIIAPEITIKHQRLQ